MTDALDLLLATLRQQSEGESIAIDDIAEAIAGLKRGQKLDGLAKEAFRHLLKVLEADAIQRKRNNAFGRLMMHPLSDLFEEGKLNRDILPNMFNFLHMVLGDAQSDFQRQCAEIVAAQRKQLSGGFTWDYFYQSEAAKRVQYRALVRVAEAFKRFELRRDWFIKLMQYHPSTISVGPNAFVAAEHHEHGEVLMKFGPAEFKLLFQTMFAPVHEMKPQDAALFQDECKITPSGAFSRFFLALEGARQSA